MTNLAAAVEFKCPVCGSPATVNKNADYYFSFCPDGCRSNSRICETFEEAKAAWQGYTRPPVAELAELTDAQLVELFDYIEVARGNAAQKHWASSETMQSWEARRKVVIAKAARQFLGRVDG